MKLERKMLWQIRMRSLSQKVERYFSLLIQLIQFVINGQSMVSNDVNRWQTDFWPPNHWRIIFPTMSPLFSQMSPLFLEPWDIVPSYEISRQNTDSRHQWRDRQVFLCWHYISWNYIPSPRSQWVQCLKTAMAINFSKSLITHWLF